MPIYDKELDEETNRKNKLKLSKLPTVVYVTIFIIVLLLCFYGSYLILSMPQ